MLDAAAAFLAVRPRSVAETRRRLRRLGYPNQLVERVVNQLVEQSYLDDASFTRSWVESRDRARPRGEAALRRELSIKGVAREVVDEVLSSRRASSSVESVDLAAALRLLQRKRSALERELDPVKRRYKAYTLLARNGFDSDTCREASASFTTPP